MPVTGTPLSTDPTRSYLTQAAADAIAAALPPSTLLAWNAASPEVKTSALELATADVDAAGPWQGRKYDPTGGLNGSAPQVLEFPRVAYETRPGPFPMAGTRGIADVIWDWDPTTNAVIVPLAVQRAVVYQADAILGGTLEPALAAQHAGLASQSAAGISESYRDRGPLRGLAILTRRAATLMERYQLKTGGLL